MHAEHEDELMDRLLRDAMASDAPELSSGFDARVMRHVRPRRLTSMGRVVMALYVVAASASALWLMHDLQPQLIVAAMAIGVPLAAGTRVYGRRLLEVSVLSGQR
jgi:hypothetical protein